MVHSKAKLKSNGDKESPCCRLLWTENDYMCGLYLSFISPLFLQFAGTAMGFKQQQ